MTRFALPRLLSISGARSLRLAALLGCAAGGAGCSSDHKTQVVDDPYTGTSAFPSQRPTFSLPAGDVGLVSNNGSDSVTMLDLQGRTVIGSAPVGRDPVDNDGPHHIAIDLPRGAAYTALSYPAPTAAPGPHAAHGSSQRFGYVQKLGITDLAPVGEVRIDKNPGDIVLSEDGKLLVVSHFDLLLAQTETDPAKQRATVALINPDSVLAENSPSPTFVTTCVAPHGVALSRPSADRAYVACYGEDALAIVDTTHPDHAPERISIGPGGTPGNPLFGPYAVVLSHDQTSAAVSDTESKDVRFFDVASKTFGSEVIATSGAPYFPAWSADDTSLFVPTQQPDSIARYDVKTGNVIKVRTFMSGECLLPHEVVFGSDSKTLYVSCEGDHKTASVVLAVDPESLDTVASMPVGIYPDRVAIAPGVAP